MMEARILRQDKLFELVDALVEKHEVIAPQGELSYGQISQANEIASGEEKPARSLKEFFLPQRQVLITYRESDGDVEMVAPNPAHSADITRIIFGARPCDAAALPILDQVFTQDPTDELYYQARKRTVVISLACNEPCKTCFCVSLGGSPAGTEGADLLLTPLGETYHVQMITHQGKALVDANEAFFQESNQRHDRERALLEDMWRAKVPKSVDMSGTERTLDSDHPAWKRLAQSCVECGICTYLCPTCHCFDIQEEGSPNQRERVRLWDTCALCDYDGTHTGQPRSTRYRRYQQRILNKFQYYPERLCRILCVGCGRCITYCPVSIDLTQMVNAARTSAA